MKIAQNSDIMNIMTQSTDECVVFTIVISNNKILAKV